MDIHGVGVVDELEKDYFFPGGGGRGQRDAFWVLLDLTGDQSHSRSNS